MSALESEMTKIKFRAFGKVTFDRSETHFRNKKIDVLQREKVSFKEGKKFKELVVVENKLSDEILKQQRTNLEREIGNLRKTRGSEEEVLPSFI